jgi:hypothetical protein
MGKWLYVQQGGGIQSDYGDLEMHPIWLEKLGSRFYALKYIQGT